MRHHRSASSHHETRGHSNQTAPSSGQVTAERPGAREEPGEGQRSAPPAAAPDKLRRAEEWLEREIERPGVGAAIIGAALVVAAATVGVGEAIVGALGAYAVYRILERRRTKHAGGR